MSAYDGSLSSSEGLKNGANKREQFVIFFCSLPFCDAGNMGTIQLLVGERTSTERRGGGGEELCYTLDARAKRTIFSYFLRRCHGRR